MAGITVAGGSSSGTTITFSAPNTIALAQSIANALSSPPVVTPVTSSPATVPAGQVPVIVLQGTGTDSVANTASGTVVVGGSNPAILNDTGAANVFFGSTGADTISAGPGGVYYLGSSTSISYGSMSGPDLFAGSTTAGSSATIVGGKSDVIFTGATALTFVADGGSSTVYGGTGSDVIHGAANSSVSYIGFTGVPIIAAGSGNETLSAAGSLSPVIFAAGSGNDTLVGGSGPNQFTFIAGLTGGGTDLIGNFSPNSTVVLQGYGANAVTSTTTVLGGSSTQITLADNTKVVFFGIGSLNGKITTL